MFFEILIFIIPLYYYLLLKKRKSSNLPSGPFQWPLLGNLPQLAFADSKFQYLQFASLCDKYGDGDMMSIKLGVHKGIVLNSWEATRDLIGLEELSGRFDPFPFATDRSFHKILGLVFTSGPLQKEFRRYTIRNLRDFGFGKRSSMSKALQDEFNEFSERFDRKVIEGGGILKIDADLFAISFVNVIWSFVAGFRFSHDDDKLFNMLKHTEAVIASWQFGNPSVAFPVLRHWFPEWSGYNHQMKAYTETHDYMRGRINEVKEKYVREGGGVPTSFIECFLQEIMNVRTAASNTTCLQVGYEEQLITAVEDLFLAGSESTAISMSYALLFMILHPEIQKKVQNEIDAVIGDGPVTTAHFEQMVYTNATMEEIFRRSHIVPMPIARKALADIAYRNYTIPKGTAVFFNLHTIMMDKKHWGDPEAFRPERFLNSTGTKVINTERNLPFGYGKRICFGDNVARQSFLMYFTSFLKKYNFEIPPGNETPSINPRFGFALHPHPFEALVTPRVRG